MESKHSLIYLGLRALPFVSKTKDVRCLDSDPSFPCPGALGLPAGSLSSVFSVALQVNDL